MKVTFCTYDGKNIINGINVWLITLLPDLIRHGIEIEVLFIIWATEQDCTTIPLLRSLGIRCTVIKTTHYLDAQIKWIISYLATNNTDVFVVNNVISAAYAAKWIQNSGIPCIGVLHNDDDEYNAFVDEFANDKNRGCLSALVAVSKAIESKLYNLSEKIIIKRIPCGVVQSSTSATYKHNEIFKIAYVGRLAQQQKNISYVVTALCEITSKISNTKAYIYGSGPDETLVYQIIDNYSQHNNVNVIGNLPHHNMMQALKDVQAIILLSEYEGLPVSIMEAMNLGVVPICKAVRSGLPELIISGKTGLYIEELSDCVEKVNSLQSNPDYWRQISVTARNHIKNGYLADQCSKEWIKLFDEVNPILKKKIIVPKKIKLSKVNKHFSSVDHREPSIWIKVINKCKRLMKGYLVE